MKILIVDRDDVSSKLIRSKIEPMGHEVYEEPVKDQVVDRMRETRFDVILMDPAPLTSARQHVLNIRRAVRYYPYVILMGEQVDAFKAVEAGANDFIAKPADPLVLDERLYQAQDLMKLVARFADDSEDFRSAGGVIAKSAFNQLFLSALDRASRYGEASYLLFISLSNYNDIVHKEGPSSADFAVAHLCQNMLQLRRQSDIVGQTKKYEYCLLLQRPLDQSEPVQAANRFAEMLMNFDNLVSENGIAFEMDVKLVELPSGRTLASHSMRATEKSRAAV